MQFRREVTNIVDLHGYTIQQNPLDSQARKIWEDYGKRVSYRPLAWADIVIKLLKVFHTRICYIRMEGTDNIDKTI